MSQNQPKLDIPVYDTASDEEILDAEIIYDESVGRGPGLRERVRSRAENVRLNGVHDAFFTQPRDARREALGEDDPSLRKRQQARAQRMTEAEAQERRHQMAAEQQERLEQLKKAAASGDAAAQLKIATARAGEDYMESLRLSGILAPEHTPQTQRKELDGLHKAYASMMVLQCMSPLQGGMRPGTLISVLGTAASMWALSPDFRTQLGSYVGQISDGIQSRIEARKNKENQQRVDKVEKKLKAVDGDEDRLSARWQKRFERMKFAERGHRLPFTNESAAMTEVALAESAYAQMRQPGADVDGVREQYNSALASLYGYVHDDGLNPEDVSRSMRVIVGKRVEKEPELAAVFAELGHGKFVKSRPSQVQVPGQDRRVTVWTGDFDDVYGGRVSSGSFKLRESLDAEGHRAQMRETMFVEMAKAQNADQLNEVLTQYAAGSAVGRNPLAVDSVSDPESRRRFGRVRSMFMSMGHDGMGYEEREFVYNAACLDSLEAVPFLDSTVVQAWVKQYGAQWRDRVTESIHIYNEAGVTTPSNADDPEQEPASRRFTASTEGVVDDLGDENSFDYEDEDIVDAEIVEDEPEDDFQHPSHDVDQSPSKSTTKRIIRARVNQEYNENDTGRVLGIGSDSAQGLQNPDFELG